VGEAKEPRKKSLAPSSRPRIRIRAASTSSRLSLMCLRDYYSVAAFFTIPEAAEHTSGLSDGGKLGDEVSE
jgi:hypothetical protein